MAKRRFCLNMTYGVLFGNVKVRRRWFNNIHNAFNCCSQLTRKRCDELFKLNEVKGWRTEHRIVEDADGVSCHWGIFLTVFRYDGTKTETKIANIIDLAMLY